MTSSDARARPAPTAAGQVTSFGRLSVAWDARILEPRPWTAAQSVWASELLDEAPEGTVLELFAGAGHIGQLAVAGNARRLVCVDLAPVACEYARRNARRNALDDRVEVRCRSITAAVLPGETFALILADPPWVRTGEVQRYPEDPRLAIDGGADGLDPARECLAVAAGCLRPGGSVVLQLGGPDQVDALSGPAHGHGLEVDEVRAFDRGSLVRLVRGADRGRGPADAAAPVPRPVSPAGRG